jgi:hypothetical protein
MYQEQYNSNEQSINVYAKFENLLLSKRNQIILQQAFVQICHLFQEKVPKHFKLLIINKTLYMFKKLSLQHQHNMNKFSWTNIQILTELVKTLETKKNYWLKFLLSKEMAENNTQKQIEKESLSYNKIKNIKNIKIDDLEDDTKPKLLSDLYEY